MSATDVRRVVEHSVASAPCLIEILKQFGRRVFILRRRLSRLKKRIQIAEKKNQPTTTLESQNEEELSVDLERYEDLLNDCAEVIHERTGIPTSKLVEVATSTRDGEEWGYIYAELNKLDERRVTAELWKALMLRDEDALVSVGLLPSSESSPPAPETENQDSKADHESGLMTMLSVGLLHSSESSPAVPETENQGSKADDESGLMTMLSVGLLPSPESSPPAPKTERQDKHGDNPRTDTANSALLKASDAAAKAFMDGKQWCTAAYSKTRFGIQGPQLTKASTREGGLFKVVVERRQAQVGNGRKGILYVYHCGSLQLLKDAINRQE